MKFVFFTDPHVKGVNPKARKDNFPETILKKIEEVHDIARDVGAVAELCGGDIYDRADVAESVVINSNRVLTKSPVDIYTVIGNHDEYGYNPETIERAMIGVIVSAGVVKRLSMDKPVIFEELNLKVGVTGCDSHYELDKLGRIEDYCPKKPEGVDVLIHVVHGFLSLNKRLEEIPHTLIDDIIEHTEADIILSGHEHSGFGVIKKRNKKGELKIICNPGALGRVSASIEEMKRMPKVAVIEVNTSRNYDVAERILKCARPGDEILDRAELERQAQQEKMVQEFSKSIESFDVGELNIYNIVDKIAKEDNIPDNVKNEARMRLQKAEESMELEVGE